LVSAFYVPFSPWFHGHLLLFYVCWTSQCHAWVFLLLPVLGASHLVEWLLYHIDLHQFAGADIHAACCCGDHEPTSDCCYLKSLGMYGSSAPP
jgi:hypothetical protein